MSSKREYSMLVSDEPVEGVEEFLTFSRWEVPYVYDEGDENEQGISIDFSLDKEERYDGEHGHYEIYYVFPKNSPMGKEVGKEKRDRMSILSYHTDTQEIRNLAAWLNEQADEIDKDMKMFRKDRKCKTDV